ncbi:MAG: ABA4-like family protein [Rhizobiaceae bacterium]
MGYELAFSAAGILAMIGWLVLLASPFYPKWSDRISGYIIPLILSIGYVVLLVLSHNNDGGGFGSLAEVMTLFSYSDALLAGWVHFLAFDLFIGAWQCRTARDEGMKFWLVIPCLALTFLLGPLGLLTFFALRSASVQFLADKP